MQNKASEVIWKGRYVNFWCVACVTVWCLHRSIWVTTYRGWAACR